MVTSFNPLTLTDPNAAARPAALDPMTAGGASAIAQPFLWLAQDVPPDSVLVDPSALPAAEADVEALAARVLDALGA